MISRDFSPQIQLDLCPIGAKLFLRRGTVEGVLKKDEHPPAMHRAMGWCKHGYINQMLKLASHRFQGIAGRSNVQPRLGVVEWEKMKKQETEELIKIFVTSINTAVKKPRLGVVECSVLEVSFSFDVGCWMFDVHLSKQPCTAQM